MLSRSQDLYPLLGEIRVETRKRESRTVNRWLANFPMETHTRTFQLHVELFSVTIIKALDSDYRNAFLLIARGSDCLGSTLFRHQR